MARPSYCGSGRIIPSYPRKAALIRSILLFAIFLGSASVAAAGSVCTLVTDARTGGPLVQTGDCATRVTPASTFKVALAVMGFDAGLLTDAHHPVLSFRKGDPDWGGADWTRDTDPERWIRYSVIWYSQRLAHELGAETLTRYATALNYGNADFAGDAGKDNGLDRAWISSSLKISPLEQAAFLRGLVLSTLPVKASAMADARALVESQTVDGWVLKGKTGTAYPRLAGGGFDYAHGWGWYVGWAERGTDTLVFVTLIKGEERARQSPGILARDRVLAQWPALSELALHAAR